MGRARGAVCRSNGVIMKDDAHCDDVLGTRKIAVQDAAEDEPLAHEDAKRTLDVDAEAVSKQQQLAHDEKHTYLDKIQPYLDCQKL